MENLPFRDDSYDKSLAVHSMQVWPDAVVGLKKMRRMMKPREGSRWVSRPISGQSKSRLIETVVAAGLRGRVEAAGKGFCALATKL